MVNSISQNYKNNYVKSGTSASSNTKISSYHHQVPSKAIVYSHLSAKLRCTFSHRFCSVPIIPVCHQNALCHHVAAEGCLTCHSHHSFCQWILHHFFNHAALQSRACDTNHRYGFNLCRSYHTNEKRISIIIEKIQSH